MPWASGFFLEQLLEDHHVQGLVCHKLLELAVLVFEQAQPSGVADLQAAELLPPLVVGGLADAVAAAEILNRSASLRFVEDLDDLFFGVSLSFHGSRMLCRFYGTSSTQLRPNHRGKLRDAPFNKNVTGEMEHFKIRGSLGCQLLLLAKVLATIK